MYFLAQKVHFAASRFTAVHELVKLLEMAIQAGDLFGDIATVRKDGYLLQYALIAYIKIETQLAESLRSLILKFAGA